MKKRHGVLALLGAVSVITFLDRLAIAVTGPGVQHELRLSPVKWGWVLISYVIANTVFETPSGALGEPVGRRARTPLPCSLTDALQLAYSLLRFWVR